jgi:outer membrane protein TolC
MIKVILWLLLAPGMLLAAEDSPEPGSGDSRKADREFSRNSATTPTTLQDVVNSSLLYFPRILAAEAEIRGAQGMVEAARGAFDPRVDGRLDARLGGFYDGRVFDAGLVQTLPYSNTRVFASYRVSDGAFPLYEGAAPTRELGELRMGFAVSLLRDRDIDENRGALNASELRVLVESQQLSAEQIGVLQQAYVAYAQWLLAARLREAYAELLQIAVERGTALERSIAAGDFAEILLVENQQAVLQRQGLVVDAERQTDMAAELLALYLRDTDGNSVYPRYDPQLAMPAENPEHFSVEISVLMDTVLDQRPEITIARLEQRQADVKKRLAENLAKPRLDLRLYSARDFGAGPDSLAGTDNVADLNFSIPLRTREARGKAFAAQAEIDSLEFRIRLLRDQIEADIRRALLNLEATRRMEQYALDELALSRTLAEAEQQRFDAGISDFFLLNVRERQVGEAQLKRWQAYLAHQVALASYYGATMQLQGFGL